MSPGASLEVTPGGRAWCAARFVVYHAGVGRVDSRSVLYRLACQTAEAHISERPVNMKKPPRWFFLECAQALLRNLMGSAAIGAVARLNAAVVASLPKAHRALHARKVAANGWWQQAVRLPVARSERHRPPWTATRLALSS